VSAAALIGAALAVGIGVAHSYLGERYILIRLFRRTDLPHLFGSDWFTRRTLRFAWHLTSVAWWGFAAVIVLLARSASRQSLGAAVAATFGATALLALVGSRGRHLSWPVFLAIAVASWFATH
jgi:hypothetical protein